MRLLLLMGINKVPLMDLISINPQINLMGDYLRTYNLSQEKGEKFKKPALLFSVYNALSGWSKSFIVVEEKLYIKLHPHLGIKRNEVTTKPSPEGELTSSFAASNPLPRQPKVKYRSNTVS